MRTFRYHFSLLLLLPVIFLPRQSFAQIQEEYAAQTAKGRGTMFARASINSTSLLLKPISLHAVNLPLGEVLKEISIRGGVRLSYSNKVVPIERSVTLNLPETTVGEALLAALQGTNVEFSVGTSGQIALLSQARVEEETGTIVGRVLEAHTNKPLPGANVVVEGTTLGALTGIEGNFKIERVEPGKYKVKASVVGYGKQAKDITVVAARQVAADFFLDETAVGLDEVVITGVAFETNKRTVPSSINVLTSKQIEEKAAKDIVDLLKGEIPGVMSLNWGLQDDGARIFVRGNSGGANADLIKTYIDGVEVSQPALLSTIDPNSIERIEVLRGPQASTIYGSQASSGVLQIFTKKGGWGSNRPKVNLSTSMGYIESKYTPSGVTPLVYENNLRVSGGNEVVSYNVGATYNKTGEWLRGGYSDLLSFSGGTRTTVSSNFIVELTGLWSKRDTRPGRVPMYDNWQTTTSCGWCGKPDFIYPNYKYYLKQSMVGLNMSYQPTARWKHNLILGNDANLYSYYQPEPHRTRPADTLLFLYMQQYGRSSVRYNTAYEFVFDDDITSRFTVGLDYWYYDIKGAYASNVVSSFGTVQTHSSTFPFFYNDAEDNFGYFGLVELSLMKKMFLTLATRIEQNDNYGENYKRSISPRAGLSYVEAFGPVEFKVRGQYGSGVRAPQSETYRKGSSSPSVIYLPNNNLGPERREGWDAGLECYWGKNTSLGITRFSEEAKDLIQLVYINEAVTPRIRQYQNIGVVKIEGWELEGSIVLDGITLKANYAYSDNVITQLSNSYVQTPNQIYWVGDRSISAPKHSGGGSLKVPLWRGVVTLNGSFVGNQRQLDLYSYYGYLYGGQTYKGSLRDYYVEYPAQWNFNFGTEQSINETILIFLRIDNITDNQELGFYNAYPSRGRTTKIGLRIDY